MVQFESAHAYEILERNVREQDIRLSPHFEDLVRIWLTEGPAYSLIRDREVIACGGIVMLGFQRGEAWTLFSSLIYRHPKACFKALKSQLDKIIRQKQLRRVQATVNPSQDASRRLMEHLGFRLETPQGMKAYGPDGETMLLYAKTKDETENTEV